MAASPLIIKKRDGNSDHLDAIVASLIFIAFSVVQRGKRA
jgi:hypothetical protein